MDVKNNGVSSNQKMAVLVSSILASLLIWQRFR
jgi:hypothetical protein